MRAASPKSHFSRKATFCEKPLFAKSDFSLGVGARGVREKPLFAKSDLSRDVGARGVREKPLFPKSHFLKSHYLRKVRFRVKG